MDDLEVWITELEDIHDQTGEIGLMSYVSENDFMLQIMGNLPDEYDAMLTDLENRLKAESSKKLTIDIRCSLDEEVTFS